MKLLQINSKCIRFLSDEQKNDKDMCLYALEKSGNAFTHIGEGLKTDHEILKKAIMHDNNSDDAMNNMTIVLKQLYLSATTNRTNTFMKTPTEMDDKEREDKLKEIDKELGDIKVLFYRILKRNVSVYSNIPERLTNSKTFIHKCIELNINILGNKDYHEHYLKYFRLNGSDYVIKEFNKQLEKINNKKAMITIARHITRYLDNMITTQEETLELVKRNDIIYGYLSSKFINDKTIIMTCIEKSTLDENASIGCMFAYDNKDFVRSDPDICIAIIERLSNAFDEHNYNTKSSNVVIDEIYFMQQIYTELYKHNNNPVLYTRKTLNKISDSFFNIGYYLPQEYLEEYATYSKVLYYDYNALYARMWKNENGLGEDIAKHFYDPEYLENKK